VGVGGRVPDDAIDAPRWAAPVYACEVILTESMTTPTPVKVRALPSFPAIERDIALLVANTLSSEKVEEVIRTAGGPLPQSLTVFDVYRGKGVPANMSSIAYRATLRAPDRTLMDEEADRTINQILARLKEDLGVE